LVFPYRGVYVRHVGHEQAVGEANQVLFFNAFEGYRISHPVPGGDASLTLVIGEAMLRELAPAAFVRETAMLSFRQQRLRIDARTQAVVALLRHSLRQNIAEPLEAETLALTLVRRALGARTTHAAGATLGRQRLVDRVNESANLVVLTGTEVRFVTTVECRQVLRVGDRSGKALPAHLTSAGKAMLALLDEERVNSILAPLNEGERSRVRREVAAARRNGYAVNNQRTETGLTALGVAVRAPDGRFVAGASLAMPAVRFAKDKVEEWVRELAACAAAIERDVARHLTATSE